MAVCFWDADARFWHRCTAWTGAIGGSQETDLRFCTPRTTEQDRLRGFGNLQAVKSHAYLSKTGTQDAFPPQEAQFIYMFDIYQYIRASFVASAARPTSDPSIPAVQCTAFPNARSGALAGSSAPRYRPAHRTPGASGTPTPRSSRPSPQSRSCDTEHWVHWTYSWTPEADVDTAYMPQIRDVCFNEDGAPSSTQPPVTR